MLAFVFLAESEVQIYDRESCHAQRFDGYLNTVPLSFALAKNHELHKNLTNAMLQIQMDGRINEIFQRYEKFLCPSSKSEDKHPKPLYPEDIAGLFVVIGIKMAVAFAWGVGMWMKRQWFERGAIDAVGVNPA